MIVAALSTKPDAVRRASLQLRCASRRKPVFDILARSSRTRSRPHLVSFFHSSLLVSQINQFGTNRIVIETIFTSTSVRAAVCESNTVVSIFIAILERSAIDIPWRFRQPIFDISRRRR